MPATPEPVAEPEPESKPGDKADAEATKQPVQVAKAERSADEAKEKKTVRKAAVSGPAAVKRAIRGDKTVVVYFYGPESADDSATGRAVAGLKDGGDVAVFKVPIRRLSAYGDLVGQLGISQAPAVVIVGRGRSARVIEGYVDPPTLRQDVADAR
ncbi:MAG TPA: hypothetical protein VEW67_04505 [Thermoleophilaceae bacterium]|nr:hypothetical protein [Thermoleophilaceae bacterium]